MDISEITDATALKAMAYDQIALKEQAEQNLQIINQRIAQVVQAEAEASEPDEEKKK